MARVRQSPTDHRIPIRNIHFNRDTARHPRLWHSNDPVPTAFFNALSCTFPDGERFFMESVRHYRDAVSPELREQIKSFVGQEAVHSREHAAFNALVSDSGYNVARLEARAIRHLAIARKRIPIRQLAATCALEHFTAILAHALLSTDSSDMIGAPEDAARLWSWHAMEEIEHKAVAYDTFLAVTRDWSGLRRYLIRIEMMLASTTILFLVIRGNMGDLYREDGVGGMGIWLRTMRYLLGKPGILRRILLPYLSYFRPSFHPWQQDDRALLAKVEQRLAAMPV